MIKITTLSSLRHREAFQLYSDVLEAIRQDESFPPVLYDLRDTFAACVSAYDSALHPPSGHHLTVELARLDVLRVREVRYLLYYLKSFLSVPEPDKQEAASGLLALLDQKAYKASPYCEKTAAIDEFLRMADLEPNRQYVQLLDVKTRLSCLQTWNEQFQTIFSNRAILLSGIKPGAVRTARIATHQVFHQLCEMLNILAHVHGEAAFLCLVERINQLISASRKAVALRRNPR